MRAQRTKLCSRWFTLAERRIPGQSKALSAVGGSAGQVRDSPEGAGARARGAPLAGSLLQLPDGGEEGRTRQGGRAYTCSVPPLTHVTLASNFEKHSDCKRTFPSPSLTEPHDPPRNKQPTTHLLSSCRLPIMGEGQRSAHNKHSEDTQRPAAVKSAQGHTRIRAIVCVRHLMQGASSGP